MDTAAIAGTAAETRRQQRLEELCAAAIRAQVGDAELRFRGRHLYRGAQRLALQAPHLRTDPAADDFGSLRGAADGMAARLRDSDPVLHAQMLPTEPVPRLVFEWAEQFRVEALAKLPGVRANLRHRHETWSLAYHRARLTESNTGLLLYTVAQILRARLTGEPVVEATEDLMEALRAQLVHQLGHALLALRRTRHDQAAFAPHALALARQVAEMAEAADEADGRQDRETADDRPLPFALWLEPEGTLGEEGAAAAGGRSPVLVAAGGAYRVFTTAYDREARLGRLARAEQLREYRERVDARIAAQGVNLPRLARELRALLAQPVDDGWDQAQEEGRIDGRRLAQLVASPTERRLFRRERVQPQADCALALLLDCSGSMKVHAESLAMVCDVLLRALELAGVDGELLGFSTGGWNGGRARRDWQRAGSPPHPGRLNEALHLVFKDAHTPWRRARPEIAGLLKADLFREGIDGEAVDWACDRLLAQPAARRILVVISDGCPMDSATILANDAAYLDQHLRDVVARREAEGAVEIRALGVGLDLSPYYRRSRVVELDGAVRNQVFRDILALLAAR